MGAFMITSFMFVFGICLGFGVDIFYKGVINGVTPEERTKSTFKNLGMFFICVYSVCALNITIELRDLKEAKPTTEKSSVVLVKEEVK